MFEECAAPLVEGLFQGYNATVLAYGQVLEPLLPQNSYNTMKLRYVKISHLVFLFDALQTGSGKTYTMGTGYRDSCQTGITPQVMNALFRKIETLKHEVDFQLHVSFIEVG